MKTNESQNNQINFLTEPMEVKFQNFNKENPRVYELYKRFAFSLIEKGHERLGSKMIMERIRWETKISTTDHEYKINNNYTAYYARMFVKEFPYLIDKFRFRKLITY